MTLADDVEACLKVLQKHDIDVWDLPDNILEHIPEVIETIAFLRGAASAKDMTVSQMVEELGLD